MQDFTSTTPELTELRADEAREITGGTDETGRAPIYDENGNVIGSCTVPPGGRLPADF